MKDRGQRAAKKQQQAERNDEAESIEEEIPGEDPGLAAEIIPEEFARQMLKMNEPALGAMDTFISSKCVNSVFLDCEDEFLRRTLLGVFRSAANIVDAAGVAEMEDVFRGASLLRFEPSVVVFEGEVVDIKSVRDHNNEVQEIELTLRATKGTKTVRLSRYMRNAISHLNIGDVVYVEPNAGFIKRLGRSESCANEYDLEGDKYVQLSKGSVALERKRPVFVSYYDFDYAFNKYSSEISMFTRSAVDSIVGDYLSTGVAEAVDSVLVINNCELLSDAQLRTLRRCMELQPWVKVMLAGSLGRMRKDSLGPFLCIRTANESPMDVLRARHGDLTEFADAIGACVGRVSLEKISDALFASKSADDFTHLLSTQLSQ